MLPAPENFVFSKAESLGEMDIMGCYAKVLKKSIYGNPIMSLNWAQ